MRGAWAPGSLEHSSARVNARTPPFVQILLNAIAPALKHRDKVLRLHLDSLLR